MGAGRSAGPMTAAVLCGMGVFSRVGSAASEIAGMGRDGAIAGMGAGMGKGAAGADSSETSSFTADLARLAGGARFGIRV